MSTTNSRPLLIGYDGSEDARQAIAEAARLFPGRPALIVSVWQELAALPAYGWAAPTAFDGAETLLDAARQEAARVAEEGAQLARGLGLDATSEQIETASPTWKALVTLADERDVEAIVVGSRGFGGVRSALLGSVSSGVVHNADHPVVVVRPQRHAEVR
jgi:nucleotide-binding universal stress UspA family protein